MVLKYNRNNSNGFSLVESIIALVIVSITIGSIYFALQSNIIFTQKIRNKISLQFMASNAYSKFILQNKILNNNSLKGESIINQKKYKWSAETVSTMIENLHTFELFIIDSNDNKKKVKTEYYVYFEEE